MFNFQLSFKLVWHSCSLASLILLIFLHVRIFQTTVYISWIISITYLGRPNKYLHCTPRDIHGKSLCLLLIQIFTGSFCLLRLKLTWAHTGTFLLSKFDLSTTHADLIWINSAAIQAAILNPVQGLYANNASAPLEEGAGLRQTYQFGLYSYCGFVNGTGLCGNHTFAKQFRPFDTISADMLGNYSVLSAAFIQNVYFRDSKNLGQLSTAACWMFLLGTIFAFLAFVASVCLSIYAF